MAELRGEFRSNEPMAGHVSWRAGGPVARAYFPADLADLAEFLRRLRPDEPLLVVGLGSNLLVRDGGFDGTAVFTHGVLSTIRQEADGTIYAEAGVASPKLARFTANLNLVGAEFLAGIPGTFGGALAMNAGCYGGETWQLVERALMLDRRGHLVERKPGEFAVGYRHVGLKSVTDEIFAGAWLRLTSRLIEAAGLKGLDEGGARVSEKHANFVVNPGGAASATAIESLIGRIQVEVRRRFGIELVREVRIVGEAK